MALSKTLQLIDNFKEPITFENAYVKVIQVTGNKKALTVLYGIYKGPDLEEALEQRYVMFPPDMNGPNPIKQAYLHLKTLPEFSNATDC